MLGRSVRAQSAATTPPTPWGPFDPTLRRSPGGSWEEVRSMATSDGSPPVDGVRAYWIGSVVVWIAVWLGTGVALRGSGQFGKVLPILVRAT